MSTLATNAITDASGGNTATINGYTPTVSNMAGRNRIINGDMRIDQRNAGASVVVNASSPYVLDRWRFWANGGGGSGASFTVQQSLTAPAGFKNSCLITQTGSTSPTGTHFNIFAQHIEGNNVSDLGWGTANAKTVTLSFWVRSSLTGTFGGVISNASQARSYPFTYTISSADTWEYKTISIPGDTSGTWLTTNGIGLEVYWQLGVGASYLGAAGSWAEAAYLGVTGATQITATNGATLYITGVQLEAGSVATPFEHRLYGQELQLCQRYFEKSYDAATVPGTATTTSFGNAGNTGQSDGTKNGCVLVFKVPKRASANMAYWDGAGTSNRFTTRHSNTWYSGRILTAVSAGENSAVIDADTGVQAPMLVHYTASAEL